MTYIRKTVTEYEIQGNYGYGYECVTTEDTYREIRKRLQEYMTNEPSIIFRVTKKRVRIK